jgi:putative ABC transport system permease protein
MPRPAIITTSSIALGSGLVLAFLFLTGAIPPAPQFIIPLAGMAIGNAMVICSLTLDRLVRETRMNRDRLEVSLALGASSAQSIAPYEDLSIRSALIPTLDSLKTLGIIFIPGTMAGLILAGTSPVVAAVYQLIVYFMIVGGGIITSITVATLARKRFFTGACQVEEWI